MLELLQYKEYVCTIESTYVGKPISPMSTFRFYINAQVACFLLSFYEDLANVYVVSGLPSLSLVPKAFSKMSGLSRFQVICFPFHNDN